MKFRYPLAIALAASIFLTAAPANADPVDFVAAAAQTTADQARAAQAYVRHVGSATSPTLSGGMPNVTCSKPTVYGIEVLPHEDLIFLESHQTDFAAAHASCVSLTGLSFQMSIEIRIEYCAQRTSLTTCRMESAGYWSTGTGDSIAGVATATVGLTVAYGDLHAAVGRPRRVYACVRTNLSGAECLTHDYSGTYGH